MLKKIEAIIREDKVNDVMDGLNEIGIVGMSMFEVRGHGRQGGGSTGRTRGELTRSTCFPRFRSTLFERAQSRSRH